MPTPDIKYADVREGTHWIMTPLRETLEVKIEVRLPENPVPSDFEITIPLADLQSVIDRARGKQEST